MPSHDRCHDRCPRPDSRSGGRYDLALAWPTPPGHLPWSTFSINTSGSFLLGLGLTWLLGRFGRTSSFPPFLCSRSVASTAEPES